MALAWGDAKLGSACPRNRVIFVYEVWAVKTVDFSNILAPKGPKQISPGQRPGWPRQRIPGSAEGAKQGLRLAGRVVDGLVGIRHSQSTAWQVGGTSSELVSVGRDLRDRRGFVVRRQFRMPDCSEQLSPSLASGREKRRGIGAGPGRLKSFPTALPLHYSCLRSPFTMPLTVPALRAHRRS